jgi:hypothetical protein
MKAPTKVIVGIDTREQSPLIFPENVYLWTPERSLVPVVTKRLKLDYGDYVLCDYPTLTAVERKASIDELHRNLCTADAERQGRAFRRLVNGVKYPYLLIESTLGGLLTPTEHCTQPDFVLQRLTTVARKFGLRPIFAGNLESTTSRRACGAFLIHLLLGHVTDTIYGLDDGKPLDLTPETSTIV